MNSRALTIGALVLALLGAAGLLLSQQSEIRRLAAEVAELRTQVGQMASLQDSNRQLAEKLKTAAEASQANQSELLRLRGTGSRLRQLEQENAKLQAQRQELNRRLSAAQEAAPLSPQQGQAAHVTTPSEAGETDLGMVELADGVPARFDLGGGTNCVVTPRGLPDGNITMEVKTEVTSADGITSKLAMSQLTARPGQYCSISVGDRMIALGAKLK
jgi:hypothetical protein